MLGVPRARAANMATQPTTAPLSTTQPSATQPASPQASDDAHQMEQIWTDLAKAEPWSSRALLDLYDRPAKTVAFLKEHLKPLKLSQEDLDKLLDALGSEDEKVWKPAFETLTYFDPRLAMGLADLVARADEPVKRNHLIEVLCDRPPDSYKGHTVQLRSTGGDGYYNFCENGSSWWAESKISRLSREKKEWMRAERAIIVLQHIGTPEALSILKEMATGHPDAEPTQVAKAALESLEAGDK